MTHTRMRRTSQSASQPASIQTHMHKGSSALHTDHSLSCKGSPMQANLCSSAAPLIIGITRLLLQAVTGGKQAPAAASQGEAHHSTATQPRMLPPPQHSTTAASCNTCMWLTALQRHHVIHVCGSQHYSGIARYHPDSEGGCACLGGLDVSNNNNDNKQTTTMTNYSDSECLGAPAGGAAAGTRAPPPPPPARVVEVCLLPCKVRGGGMQQRRERGEKRETGTCVMCVCS
jgi:hypothetical protein